MSARVQVFPVRIAKGPDRGKPKGEWAFRVRASNSRMWVVSEGYTRQRSAERAASRFLLSLQGEVAAERKHYEWPDRWPSVVEVVDR